MERLQKQQQEKQKQQQQQQKNQQQQQQQQQPDCDMVMLSANYRSHASILSVPSELFYGGKLQVKSVTEKREEDSKHVLNFLPPDLV
jgi:superfamily I DNA and/or RNA helicase